MRTAAELHDRLTEQEGFLRRSLHQFYDSQCLDEALRIATIVRILVHDTAKSSALLKQLRPEYLNLPMLELDSETDPALRPRSKVFRMVSTGISIGPDGARPFIDLTSPKYRLGRLETWWGQTVHALQGPGDWRTTEEFSRKDIILALANKEGGAHVDPDESGRHRRLRREIPFVAIAYGQQIANPNFARYISAESGVLMLDCLKRNFLPNIDLPTRWPPIMKGPSEAIHT